MTMRPIQTREGQIDEPGNNAIRCHMPRPFPRARLPET
jgi:hypothetical protein